MQGYHIIHHSYTLAVDRICIMGRTMAGYVFMVRRHTNGDIDVGFYHDDQEDELHYFSDSSRGGSLTKEVANALAETLGRNIWTEIQFGDDGISTSVELTETEEYDESEDD